MTALHAAVDALPGLDVLVVGDALLDEYLDGAGDRLCREAPVPVVTVRERQAVPGGAGNTAANAAALGARVRLLTAVGRDADGRLLTQALRDAGVDVRDVLAVPNRATVTKRRVSAGGQLVARFDDGEPAPLDEASRAAFLQRLPALFSQADVVIVSDYGYGVLDAEVVDVLAGLQRVHPRVLVVDAHDLSRYRHVPATALTPSYAEVSPLLADTSGDPDGTADRAATVVAQAARLHAETGVPVLAVTLDADGAVVCERGRAVARTLTVPVPASRTCGAGDTFTAAFALTLAATDDPAVAAAMAQAAADVVGAREGTCVCTLAELRERVAPVRGLEPPEQVAARVSGHREQGRRVVFTNGCFDLLHRGHVDLLARARSLGDVLVVGVNSDDSIRHLKGTERPINTLEDRAEVLAALRCVDHVVAFEDTTATGLVQLLRPDVYVKGGDYTPAMVPEAVHVEAYGGQVHILPYVEGRSTTGLVDRIRGGAEAVRLPQTDPVELDR